MPEAFFGSAAQDFTVATDKWGGYLVSPRRILLATEPGQVLDLLNSAEAEACAGKWVALMLSYEAGLAFDSALKTHPPSEFPLAWAAVFDQVSSTFPTSNEPRYKIGTWKPRVSRAQFYKAVARIRKLIELGETYQVNYCFPLDTSFTGEPRDWYRTLCAAQGAKYCAYLDLGRYQILSLSPELFFERHGNSVSARPMKGTMHRGRWSTEDTKMARKLAQSAKDRAENVMIVDLLRNDLGKVSLPGSVKVTRLFELEQYPTLWQMTSSIESVLRPGTSLSELLTALFPCGSITGAPKIRTMEIIRDLESVARNVYTGTIGLVRPGGDSVFNVAIRTIVLDSDTGQATFGVGAGITYDSQAKSEYEECLLKSSFLDFRVPSFRLLESMLLEDGAFFLTQRHLSRLSSSAAYFNFSFKREEILSKLKDIGSNHPRGRWKLRLFLAKNGDFETEVLPLEDRKLPLRVALAAEPVNSSDRFLFHKTTERSAYERALASQRNCDDVVLWNERDEITESTIANVVLNQNGQLWTPTQASGLLAGTLREELIAAGKIRERAIRIEELKASPNFFLINSVQKWMSAVLVN